MAVARDDLHLHVGTSADSKGLTEAARKLDATTDSSDGLGRSLKETGKESERAEFRLKELTKNNRKLSDGFKTAGKDSRKLSDEIRALQAHIKNLGQEYDRTGNRDLFKQIRRGRGELANLRRIQSDIGAAQGLAAAGAPGMGEIALKMAPLIVPAVGALAVTIGGVIAGAVSGLTVGGGMLGGILSATKDGRVRAAASEFGDTISKEFFSGGAVFADPVVDSLKILQDDFASMNLGTAFAKAAPDVETLAHGIGDMGKNLMPGFNRVMDRSGEYTGILAGGLADTGKALSDMLITLVESKGAADGLRGAFVGLTAAIEDGGDLLGGLSDGFHFFATGAAYATGALEDFLPVQILSGGMQDEWNNRWEKTAQVGEYASTAMHKFNQDAAEQRRAFDAAENSMRDYAGATTFAAGEVIKLNSALEDTRRKFVGWKSAEADAEEAIDNLALSLDENGKTFDIHTQKGRDNQRALEDVAKASAEAAQQKYNETGSLAQAQKVYDIYRQDLIKTLIQAGLTRKEAEKLAEAWLGVPGHVSTVIETTYVTRKVSGDEYKESVKAGARHQKRAGGGSALAGNAYIVGDGGRPEVLQMGSQSGHVYPSVGAWQSAMGGVQMSARPLNVSGSGLGDLVLRWLRNEVQAQGGTLAVLGISS